MGVGVGGVIGVGGTMLGESTVTVAEPCACFELVAAGKKMIVIGTDVEALPEINGVIEIELLVEGTVNAVPQGMLLATPATPLVSKWKPPLHS